MASPPPAVDALLREAFGAIQAGDWQRAASIAGRAVAFAPDSADAHHLAALAARNTGRLPDAIASLERAVALRPAFFEAWLNLGNAFLESRDPERALRCYATAEALDASVAQLHNNAGNAHRDSGRPAEAIAAYRRALAIDPRYASAHSNLGNVLKDLGDAEGAVREFREALALVPDRPDLWSNLLFTLNCVDTATPASVFEEHRAYGARFSQRIAELAPAARRPIGVRRLKVGYVSADFRGHAVAAFFEPVLAAHDRSRVEVFCYYNQMVGDDVTARIQALSEHFVPVRALTDRELAARIRADGIDVLVDLNGHTADNRLPLFFLRPAPVQATWLGYLGTTGVPQVDYRISDRHADPEGVTERFHTERLWRLPRTLWCYRAYAEAPAVAPAPAEAARHVTFACLNSPGKVSARMLEDWARILNAVDGSRLLLLAAAHPARAAELQAFFAARGVDRSRLEIVSRRPLRDYLALYAAADIALDTSPYGGGATTCDALWMGVPVVTLATDRSFGRSAASILANVGLQDLVATTRDGYVECAVGLARDLDRLRSLRASLRERMARSPLLDAAGFARDLEDAFFAMSAAVA